MRGRFRRVSDLQAYCQGPLGFLRDHLVGNRVRKTGGARSVRPCAQIRRLDQVRHWTH